MALNNGNNTVTILVGPSKEYSKNELLREDIRKTLYNMQINFVKKKLAISKLTSQNILTFCTKIKFMLISFHQIANLITLTIKLLRNYNNNNNNK